MARPSPSTTVEWQLTQLPAGAQVLIKDDKGSLVARGIVNPDRVSLTGPDGQRIPLMTGHGWQVIVQNQLGKNGR